MRPCTAVIRSGLMLPVTRRAFTLSQAVASPLIPYSELGNWADGAAADEILAQGDSRELEGFCAVLTEVCAMSDQHGDYTRMFTKYPNRRERVLRRRYRRHA